MEGDDQPGDRVVEPWATAFDLILSEYAGYTDESILDLTIDRIQQMVKAIARRRDAQRRYEERRMLATAELHAKSLGMLLAGVAQTKKASKGISAAAKSIDFLGAHAEVSKKDAEKPKEREVPTVAMIEATLGIQPTGLVAVRS